MTEPESLEPGGTVDKFFCNTVRFFTFWFSNYLGILHEEYYMRKPKGGAEKKSPKKPPTIVSSC